MSVSLNAMMFLEQLNTSSPLGFGGTEILTKEYAAGFRADYRTPKEDQSWIKINCKTIKNCLTPLARCDKKAQTTKKLIAAHATQIISGLAGCARAQGVAVAREPVGSNFKIPMKPTGRLTPSSKATQALHNGLSKSAKS